MTQFNSGHEPLSEREASLLAELEAAVTRNLAAVGASLLRIQELRLYRGTHTTFESYCRERFGFGRAHAYRLTDRARVDAILSPTGDTTANEAQARELAPLLHTGDEQAIIDVVAELRAKYGDDKVTAPRIRTLVGNRLKRVRREEVANTARENAPLFGSTHQLIHRSIAELTDADIPPGSVHAIITDPIYSEENLPDYTDLGTLAKRVLVPDGSLLCMTSQAILPDVLAQLRSHLDYRWTLAYLLTDNQSEYWPRNIRMGWKPVVWLTNGDLGNRGRRPWVGDTPRSGGRDKRFHIWGQSVGGFAQIVEGFTNPGDRVLDSFVGGGTTGVACLELGRNFIGCDSDAVAIATTATRLMDITPQPDDVSEAS